MEPNIAVPKGRQGGVWGGL